MSSNSGPGVKCPFPTAPRWQDEGKPKELLSSIYCLPSFFWEEDSSISKQARGCLIRETTQLPWQFIVTMWLNSGREDICESVMCDFKDTTLKGSCSTSVGSKNNDPRRYPCPNLHRLGLCYVTRQREIKEADRILVQISWPWDGAISLSSPGGSCITLRVFKSRRGRWKREIEWDLERTREPARYRHEKDLFWHSWLSRQRRKWIPETRKSKERDSFPLPLEKNTPWF